MSRLSAIMAVFTIATSTALAEESLPVRIHNAAIKACLPESSASLPHSHYDAITQHCIARITKAASARIEARAHDGVLAENTELINR